MRFAKDSQTSIPGYERLDLLDVSERDDLIHMIDFAVTNRKVYEQLLQLHRDGPCWDGDVISKYDRDQLLRIGACAKVIVKGDEGYNACTYFGRRLLQLMFWLRGEFE